MQTVSKVLVPVDLRAISWESLEYAAWMARRFGATLDVLYAMSPPMFVYPDTLLMNDKAMTAPRDAVRREMDGLVALLLRRISPKHDEEVDDFDAIWGEPKPSVETYGHVRIGHASRIILEFADQREHDLIVMGTHGRTGLAHLVRGSVAEKIVRLAQCPVLVVPGVRLHAAAQVTPDVVRAAGTMDRTTIQFKEQIE